MGRRSLPGHWNNLAGVCCVVASGAQIRRLPRCWYAVAGAMSRRKVMEAWRIEQRGGDVSGRVRGVGERGVRSGEGCGRGRRVERRFCERRED